MLLHMCILWVLTYDSHIWVVIYVRFVQILIYEYFVTHIWVSYACRITNIRVVICLILIYECWHMITHIWEHAYDFSNSHMSARHMILIYDPSSKIICLTHMIICSRIWFADIWWFVRIWYSYMSMQTYDTHIWVHFPVRWKSQVTRARQQIHRKEVLNNPKYYRLLPLYFQALREQHPHSLFDIEFDNHGHFERAIIVFDAVRDIVGYCRNVTGIDAGHSKHVCYTGVVVTLCAQFGCGRTIDIGAAAVTGEKKVEYEWIASKMKHYVSRLLNRPGHLNISDRDKGIPHFTKNFHCWGAKCAWHIRKNVWTQKPVSMCIRMCMSCVCMRCACDTWYMYVMYDSPGCDHGQRQENPW